MPAKVKRDRATAPIARPGDLIVVESERVGQPPREGEILGVRESEYGPSFEIRWDDGHVSDFRPAAGSARIVHREKSAAR